MIVITKNSDDSLDITINGAGSYELVEKQATELYDTLKDLSLRNDSSVYRATVVNDHRAIRLHDTIVCLSEKQANDFRELIKLVMNGSIKKGVVL